MIELNSSPVIVTLGSIIILIIVSLISNHRYYKIKAKLNKLQHINTCEIVVRRNSNLYNKIASKYSFDETDVTGLIIVSHLNTILIERNGKASTILCDIESCGVKLNYKLNTCMSKIAVKHKYWIASDTKMMTL